MKATLIFTFLCIWFPTVTLCSSNIRMLQKPDSGATPTGKPGSSTPVTGQSGKPTTPASSGTATSGKPTPISTPYKKPYVIDIETPMSVDSEKQAKGWDQIRIKISNPTEFMDSRPADRNKLELYANDIELKGITSELFNNVSKASFKTRDTVMWIPFVLKRDSATKGAWDNLYRLTGHWYKNNAKLRLTVGWEGMIPLENASQESKKTVVTLIVFSNAVFIWMSIFYLLLLVGLGWLVLTTDILKEGSNGAFSLAQTQLAYWTILVLAGFVYSLLITGIPTTINTSVLTLLGISMGTNGIARYIDYFKKPERTKPADGQGAQPVAPVNAQAPAIVPVKPHIGFWRDILGDGDSINMQRFQILAWNIVLGGYFVYFTFNNKTMPVIPDVLLTLAGLSSLTYVAAKPTEKTVTDVQKAQ